MENYCAFNKEHTYIKWLDYMLTLQELEETDMLYATLSSEEFVFSQKKSRDAQNLCS